MIPKNLLDELNFWISNKKYGNLQINFCDGKIVNVNRFESVKIDLLTRGSITDSSNSFASPSII